LHQVGTSSLLTYMMHGHTYIREHYFGSFGNALFDVAECIWSCSYLGL